MSTETIDKKHDLKDVSVLSIAYLRNAINNPQWASGLQDWVDGCDTLRAIPSRTVPKGMTDDDAIFKWAETTDNLTLTDKMRDTCRTALKKSFELKALPINHYSVALITLFSLK